MKRVLVQTQLSRIPDFFTHPIRFNRSRLRNRGYDVEFSTAHIPEKSSDIILLCSKVFSPWWGNESERIFSSIETLRERNGKIIWCDDSDSSGITHFELFPVIDLYLKKQLLTDRTKYSSESYYGDRSFTDFYHRRFGIDDETMPFHSKALDPSYQDRVALSWHIGLGDMWGDILPRPVKWARRRLPANYGTPFFPADGERDIDFSFRGSRKYSRPTVSFHRERIGEILDGIKDLRTGLKGRVSIRQYRDEMRHSKMVVSPFGWGEIGVRDFECWINGAALVKPDMSHMVTWPDIFVPGETYQPIQWDFSDLESSIENLMEDNAYRLRLAEEGQDRFRKSISPEGMDQFCDWFIQQIEL